MNITLSADFITLVCKPSPLNSLAPVLKGDNPRQKILALEAAMREMEQGDFPVKHHFAPGSYGREILLSAGSLVVGKIHKHAHLNVISQGHCTVYTEFGEHDIKAPHTFVSLPGTKRVVLSHTEVVWTTMHVTNETDLEKIEDELIAKSYEDLALLQHEERAQIEHKE